MILALQAISSLAGDIKVALWLFRHKEKLASQDRSKRDLLGFLP